MFTNNGVAVNVHSLFIPDGTTLPSVTTFETDGDPKYTKILEVDRATVQDADRSTTFLNIINNATIGISKQAADLVQADFDETANDVTMYVNWYDIDTNIKKAKDNDFYNDADDKFLCYVEIYVETAAA